MSTKKLAWNSGSSVALFFTEAMVSLMMTPIVIGALGRRDYGLWELMLGVVGYLGVLDLGVGPAVVRQTAHAHANEDAGQLNRVFNTGLATMFTAGFVGALIVVFLSVWGDAMLGLQRHEVPYIGLLFMLFAVHLLLGFTLSSLVAFLMGLQNHAVINFVRVCTATLQAILIYNVLTSDREPALVYMSCILLGINALQTTVFVLWVRRHSPVRFDRRSISLKTARQLFSFGMKSTLLMASGTIIQRATLFVTAHVVGVAAIAFYAIPSRLAEYARNLGMALGFPLTPYFTSVATKGGMQAARDVWFPTSRALQFVTLGMPTAAMWMGEAFMRRWVGPEYAVNGRWVLYFLCGALLIQGIASNANRMLFSMGKHGRIAILSAILAPVAVVLSVVFGKWWGLSGIAAAVALYSALQALGELYFACRELEIPIMMHMAKTVFVLIPPLALCSFTFYGLQHVWPPLEYSEILAQGLLGGVVYLVSAYAFSLYPNERAAFLAWVARRFRSSPVQGKL